MDAASRTSSSGSKCPSVFAECANAWRRLAAASRCGGFREREPWSPPPFRCDKPPAHVKRAPGKTQRATGRKANRSELRLLIVDDHIVVRRGLREILSSGFPSASFSEARNAAEMLEKARQQSWSAIIMDITMPGRNGLDALRDLKLIRPSVPVL